MKIGVSTYSFQRLINEGKLSQLTCIQKAKELGFESIDFTDIAPDDDSSEAEFAKKISDECKRLNMIARAHTCSADFINGSNGVIEDEIERLKKKVDIAEILGMKLLRHDATFGMKPENGRFKSFEKLLPILVEGCTKVTQYAKTKGIKTMVENHGYVAQDSDSVELLINTVDDENFGLLLDMGNFMCVDENPAKAIGKLAPYAFHVHAKDFHVKSGNEPNPGKGWFMTRSGNYMRGSIIGHGNLAIQQYINILKKAGYNDTFTIEFEGMEDNMLALEIGYENLKGFVEG